MKKLILLFVALISFHLLTVLYVPSVSAADPVPAIETIRNPVKSETFIALAFRIMKLLLGMAAGLAVVFVMVGATQFMISRGNPEQVTKGKDTIVWALLGLLIALFAFSLVAIVQNLLLTYFK